MRQLTKGILLFLLSSNGIALAYDDFTAEDAIALLEKEQEQPLVPIEVQGGAKDEAKASTVQKFAAGDVCTSTAGLDITLEGDYFGAFEGAVSRSTGICANLYVTVESVCTVFYTGRNRDWPIIEVATPVGYTSWLDSGRIWQEPTMTSFN